MNTKVKIKLQFAAIALVAGHLLMTAVGATHFKFTRIPFIGAAIDQYGTITGANNTYPFFAPNVGGQIRVMFKIKMPHNEHLITPLEIPGRNETNLRIANLERLIEDTEESEEAEYSDENSSENNVAGNNSVENGQSKIDVSKMDDEQLAALDQKGRETYERTLAASLAGKILIDHVDAQSIEVRFENLDPVSNKDYVAGRRGKWELIYSSTFEPEHKQTTSIKSELTEETNYESAH